MQLQMLELTLNNCLIIVVTVTYTRWCAWLHEKLFSIELKRCAINATAVARRQNTSAVALPFCSLWIASWALTICNESTSGTWSQNGGLVRGGIPRLCGKRLLFAWSRSNSVLSRGRSEGWLSSEWMEVLPTIFLYNLPFSPEGLPKQLWKALEWHSFALDTFLPYVNVYF